MDNGGKHVDVFEVGIASDAVQEGDLVCKPPNSLQKPLRYQLLVRWAEEGSPLRPRESNLLQPRDGIFQVRSENDSVHPTRRTRIIGTALIRRDIQELQQSLWCSIPGKGEAAEVPGRGPINWPTDIKASLRDVLILFV
jgi:hypothetical protein